MRITFITTKINFERAGGSVPDLDLKVRDMRGFGAAVRVVTVFSEHNLLPPDLPYQVIEEFTPNKSLPALQRRVYEVLKKYEPDTDVYHIEGQFAYAAGWYRRQGGKPLVAFFNREMLAWERGGARRAARRLIEQFLFRTIVPRIDYCYFTTPQLLQCYRDFGFVNRQERVSTMLDFFDPEAIRKKAPARRAHGKLNLFASGRMVEQKGFHLLIEALALLPENLREKTAVLIGGDGPERERLKGLAMDKQVPVQFPGWISKEAFWQELADADIFVLPRWRIEQPSVIVMEALSLGIPTVAPGGGGVEWMARDAVATFADSDSRSLSQTLQRVIENPAEHDRLRKACARRVGEIDHAANRQRLFDIIKSVAHA